MESWRRLTPHAPIGNGPAPRHHPILPDGDRSPFSGPHEGYRVVTSLPAASGTGPAAGLTLSADGTTFYGTRWATSSLDSLVFSVGVDGSNYQTLSSFPDRALGGLALGNSQTLRNHLWLGRQPGVALLTGFRWLKRSCFGQLRDLCGRSLSPATQRQH